MCVVCAGWRQGGEGGAAGSAQRTESAQQPARPRCSQKPARAATAHARPHACMGRLRTLSSFSSGSSGWGGVKLLCTERMVSAWVGGVEGVGGGWVPAGEHLCPQSAQPPTRVANGQSLHVGREAGSEVSQPPQLWAQRHLFAIHKHRDEGLGGARIVDHLPQRRGGGVGGGGVRDRLPRTHTASPRHSSAAASSRKMHKHVRKQAGEGRTGDGCAHAPVRQRILPWPQGRPPPACHPPPAAT